MIDIKQQELGWGKSVVETLSKDLRKEFPGIQGFGTRNIWYMQQFYAEYQANEILQPLVAEISWTKHLLIHKIELKSFDKYLLGQTNFDKTLPNKIKKIKPF